MTSKILTLEYERHWTWKKASDGTLLKPKIRKKIKKWLTENCVEPHVIIYESGNNPIIMFKDEYDLMAFKLTWW